MIPKRTAIQLLIFNIMIGFVIFFMIEVIFGQLIMDWVEMHGDNSFMLMIIITIGFFISGIIGIVSVHFTSSFVDSRYINLIALLTFVINFLLWAILSIIFTWNILADLSILQKVIRIGKVMTVFSATLVSPTLLWLLAQITFSIIYVLILVFAKVPIYSKVKNTKKSNGRWL